MDKKRFIFIVGCPRSGTSMISYLIGSHKDAFFIGESGFMLAYLQLTPIKKMLRKTIILDIGIFELILFRIKRVIKKKLNIGTNHVFYTIKQILVHDKISSINKEDILRDLKSRRESVERELNNNIIMAIVKEITSYSDINDFLDVYSENYKYIVEKTPIHYKYLNTIRALYPDSKIIFVHRNPHDVIASMLLSDNIYGKYIIKRINKCVKEWLNSERVRKKEQSNVYNLKYEDFINNPYQNMLRLLEYLELRQDSFDFNLISDSIRDTKRKNGINSIF